MGRGSKIGLSWEEALEVVSLNNLEGAGSFRSGETALSNAAGLGVVPEK